MKRHKMESPKQITVSEYASLAENVARSIADQIRQVIKKQGYCVVTPSAGKTLVDTFKILRDRYSKSLDWGKVICVQMDDYERISCYNECSFAYQINREFVEPLGIEHFMRFNGENGEKLNDLELYESIVDALGGIDLAIHGVGVNGHIGFNEPGDTEGSKCRRVLLREETIEANSTKYRSGITLGLRQLSEAKASIIVFSGKHKREAATMFLENPPTLDIPVTVLKNSSGLQVFIDTEASPE